MLLLQHLSYRHPNKDLLFQDLNFSISNRKKIALAGNNGTGKSTLLRIIAGELHPTTGTVTRDTQPYHVPQVYGQYDNLTVAQALGVDQKLQALRAILRGDTTEANFRLLEDDWTVEERCRKALAYWLPGLDQPDRLMGTLSGGEQTRVFLAGLDIHQSRLVLMDEPSNHLDREGRKLLYDFIRTTTSTLLVVSHDRKLLNLFDTIVELGPKGLTLYGGNYDFYVTQKEAEALALMTDIADREKALRKARDKQREVVERQQKLDARGRKKQEKAGVARIMMNTLRNKAEQSTSKAKSVHEEKTDAIARDLDELRGALPGTDRMKLGFEDSPLHKRKILAEARKLNMMRNGQSLWKNDLDLLLTRGERIALKGANGSGKTTLLQLVLGRLTPDRGTMNAAEGKTVYIDQAYALIDNGLTLYEQAQAFNETGLEAHEIKTRLHRFLFGKDDWDKPCGVLSGGERMRLMLCCLTIMSQSPDLIVLDEPTNNLDLQNVAILAAAMREYRGTLLAVSHDEHFLGDIGIERTILLERNATGARD